MTSLLPSFPPLFSMGGWWRSFIAGRLDGKSSDEAVKEANAACGLRPREWMRFRIEGDAVLSVPVSGGASTLKNRPSQEWLLSPGVARDGRKIEATLATVYGKYPYFSLLRADIMPDYRECKAGEICWTAFHKINHIIGLDDEDLLEELKRRMTFSDTVIKRIKVSYTGTFTLELSILDILFKAGPDAIFALLPSF